MSPNSRAFGEAFSRFSVSGAKPVPGGAAKTVPGEDAVPVFIQFFQKGILFGRKRQLHGRGYYHCAIEVDLRLTEAEDRLFCRHQHDRKIGAVQHGPQSQRQFARQKRVRNFPNYFLCC